jgi:hypothetical protein
MQDRERAGRAENSPTQGSDGASEVDVMKLKLQTKFRHQKSQKKDTVCRESRKRTFLCARYISFC